jgi:hypothetical protein
VAAAKGWAGPPTAAVAGPPPADRGRAHVAGTGRALGVILLPAVLDERTAGGGYPPQPARARHNWTRPAARSCRLKTSEQEPASPPSPVRAPRLPPRSAPVLPLPNPRWPRPYAARQARRFGAGIARSRKRFHQPSQTHPIRNFDAGGMFRRPCNQDRTECALGLLAPVTDAESSLAALRHARDLAN